MTVTTQHIDLNVDHVTSQTTLDPELAGWTNENMTALFQEETRRLALRVQRYLAYLPWEKHIKVPATWWDHFKARWFPAWALERWPVNYHRYEPRMYFPNVPLPLEPPYEWRVTVMKPLDHTISEHDAEPEPYGPEVERLKLKESIYEIETSDDPLENLRTAILQLERVRESHGIDGMLRALRGIEDHFSLDKDEALRGWVDGFGRKFIFREPEER